MKDFDQKLLDTSFDGNADAVKDAISQGADVNTKDTNGLTALIRATLFWRNSKNESDKEKGYNTVKALLDAGADVNGSNKIGHTAIHWSVNLQKFNPQISSLFLQYGADVTKLLDENKKHLDQTEIDRCIEFSSKIEEGFKSYKSNQTQSHVLSLKTSKINSSQDIESVIALRSKYIKSVIRNIDDINLPEFDFITSNVVKEKAKFRHLVTMSEQKWIDLCEKYKNREIAIKSDHNISM